MKIIFSAILAIFAKDDWLFEEMKLILKQYRK